MRAIGNHVLIQNKTDIHWHFTDIALNLVFCFLLKLPKSMPFSLVRTKF